MTSEKKIPLKLALNELFLLDNIEESISSLIEVTESFTEVIESIYEGKTELREGEVFIETLSVKILITTKSIIELTKGFSLQTKSMKSEFQSLDFSSINILTRAIIESFLTMEYLFYNDLQDEEKNFRFLIWRISGYK